MKITLNRMFWARLVAILLVLLFAVFLFFLGRQHTVLVDNKTITVEGKEYRALQLVEIQVDKQPSMELAARDRDKFEVTKQSHTVTMTFTDSNWDEKTIVRKIKIPLMEDMAMILIPVLAANPEADQSVWLQNYVAPTVAATPTADEVVVTDDLSTLVSL